MILALNNMKGFDTDVLAVLQQTSTTPVSTSSTSHLDPEFAVGVPLESESNTNVTNQRESIQMEEEMSFELESDLQSPILHNSELIGLLQGSRKSGSSSEVNCNEELEDVREAKTMTDNDNFTDNATFVDPELFGDSESVTESDVPNLSGSLLLSDTTTTSDFLQNSSIPSSGSSSLSPANKLQSEEVVTFSRSSNQAVVIASAISVSLVLFVALILLAYVLKKHRKKLLLWLSQWKPERSPSQQVI